MNSFLSSSYNNYKRYLKCFTLTPSNIVLGKLSVKKKEGDSRTEHGNSKDSFKKSTNLLKTMLPLTSDIRENITEK